MSLLKIVKSELSYLSDVAKQKSPSQSQIIADSCLHLQGRVEKQTITSMGHS